MTATRLRSPWLRRILAEVPGAEELFPGVVRLPGISSPRMLAAASLVIDGPRPLLVDAGMRREVAEALRRLGLPLRLHLTHLHIDHRIHQGWFDAEGASAPAVEAPWLVDWDAWMAASGFPAHTRPFLDQWLLRIPTVRTLPRVEPLADGALLEGLDMEVRLRLLPGHTAGHSGLEFPEHEVILVTDYDMEPFGPWYGNTMSDLDAYEATLERILAEGWSWYVTAHRRGMLDAEAFAAGAERYRAQIAERSERIAAAVAAEPGVTIETLAPQGFVYAARTLERNPMLLVFERRMIELHLERLEREGAVRREGDRWLPA